MNPVTATLVRRVGDRAVIRFVEQWDALEALVIRTYRTGRAGLAAQWSYRRLRRALRRSYPRYAEALGGYWRGAMAGGEPLTEDPFRALLGAEGAPAFVDNWRAMELLPAARQAINEWLLDLVGGGEARSGDLLEES